MCVEESCTGLLFRAVTVKSQCCANRFHGTRGVLLARRHNKRSGVWERSWGSGEELGFVPQLRGWVSSATESVSGTVGPGAGRLVPM